MLALIPRSLRSAIRTFLLRLGISVSRAGRSIDRPDLAGALERLASRAPTFNTVIDVGAAVGEWSGALAKHFPGKRHLLIEANPVHESALVQACAGNPGWSFALKAAGERPGFVYFDGGDPFGGQASLRQDAAHASRVPVTSIDAEVAERQLKGPFLIKLDTHGFELPILAGAEAALKDAEVLVIECYAFQIAEGSLKFWEMCAWLAARGFSAIDLFDLLYRPHDRALWQMDIVFMKSSRPEFGCREYA